MFLLGAVVVAFSSCKKEEDPPQEYTVFADHDGNGTTQVSTAKSIAGETVILTATPNEGYTFKQWMVPGSDDVYADNPLSLTMPAADMSLRAEFTQLVKSYTFEISWGEGGTIAGTTKSGKYEPGVRIHYSALAQMGYVFKQWTVIGDVSIDVTQPGGSFIMPAGDVSLRAEFERIPDQGKAIGIVVEGNGSVLATVDGEEVTQAGVGQRVVITAMPDGNASGWTIDSHFGIYHSEQVSFTMPFSDVSITVKFFDLPTDVPPSVEIDGVTWATRNVGKPGTFVGYPWEFGGYYNFVQAQEVCPAGWRTPTVQEVKNLKASANQWVTVNGTNGRLFGSGEQTLFLPAAGYWRGSHFGDLNAWSRFGSGGLYWADTWLELKDNPLGQAMIFSDSRFDDGLLFISSSSYAHDTRDHAFSVRCVKK